MQHMSPQMQWGNDKAHQLYIENRLAVGEVMEVSPNGLHFYSCNMGTSGLPDMYIRCPRAADHSCPCYNYYATLPKANSLNADMNTTTGFFIYALLKGPIMVMQQ